MLMKCPHKIQTSKQRYHECFEKFEMMLPLHLESQRHPPIMQAVRIRRSKRIRMPTDCTLDVNRLIKLASQQTETLKLPQPAKPAKIHAKAFSS